jgi:hypothetical protein
MELSLMGLGKPLGFTEKQNPKPRAAPGSARRELPHGAVFARAATLPAAPALARWRRPLEREKKAEQIQTKGKNHHRWGRAWERRWVLLAVFFLKLVLF